MGSQSRTRPTHSTVTHLGLSWWLRQLRICLKYGRPGFDSWIGKIPWRRAWQPRGNPLQYPCLENPHGQRSLAGYSPWGRKESDTTKQLSLSKCVWPIQGALCSVAPLCPILWDPMACSPPGSSVHGDSPGKNTGVGCHFLLCGSFQPGDRMHVSCVSCIG